MINFLLFKKKKPSPFEVQQNFFIARSKEIVFWVQKIRELKLDQNQKDLQLFWQNYDHFFNIDQKINKPFLKDKKNFDLLKQINLLDLQLFKDIIISELKKHWKTIKVDLQKLSLFDKEKDKIKKICSSAFNFSQDLDQNFQFKKNVFHDRLNFNKKNTSLLNLKIITVSKIETFLLQTLYIHLLPLKKYLLKIKAMELSFDQLLWWKNTFINQIDFNLNDYQWKKSLKEHISNSSLESFKFIADLTQTKLKNFIIQEVENHWKLFVFQLQRIQYLSLLFANQELWLDTRLNFNSDLDKNCFLRPEGYQKVIDQSIKVWQGIKKITFKKLQNFIETQIVNSWYQNRSFFSKIKILSPSFFDEKDWKKTSLDIDKLLDKENTKEVITNLFKSLTDQQLKDFLNLDMNFLRQKIDFYLQQHWQKNCFLVEKIIIFGYHFLENDKKWKKLELKLNLDLKKDGTLLSLKNGDFDQWSWEKINIFHEIDDLYLRKIFNKIVAGKSDYLKKTLAKAKKNDIDLSKEDFWLKTNLNWQNDIDYDGNLTKSCLNSLFYKNLTQLRFFVSLEISKINRFIDFYIKNKVLDQKKDRFYLWKKIKNWFFFFKIKQQKSFSERLGTKKIIFDSFLGIKKIENYSDFNKNEKTYLRLRKYYNQRIINDQEIIGVYDSEIDPIKYIIEIKNVSKYFLIGRKINTVLDNINLKIRRGDFVVILGPSGAGKSSLLNLISGIDNANVGDVFVNGYNLSLLNPSGLTEFRRKYVGFIFQQYNLLSNLTAHENVEISLALLPSFKEAIDLYQLFQFLKIDHLLDKYPFQLSGGEQQRFSIARSLAKNPDILFCDEPTGALDQKMSQKVMKTLMEINVKYGTTVIIVTHNNEYIKIAKTIINFRDGKIVNHYQNARQIDPEKIT